ncbi:MAG: hypothetical protein QM758_03645 [Armatimonas sp.]
MKIRWMEESLRLRITPGELQALQQGEVSTEAAAFPGGWVVTLQPGSESILCTTGHGVIRITLSPEAVAELSQPATEGVYFNQESYRFLVEKDFPCVHPRPAEASEPQTETFAPPSGFAERKQ